jgi:hypothetical protein
MTEFRINFNNVIIDKFIESLDANTSNYYVFAGKYTEWNDENNPEPPTLSLQNADFDVRNNLLFGKKLTSADTAKLIRKIEWSSNTVYDAYDHRDNNLLEKDFFVVNSSNNVYKCLFNNNEIPSTFEPSYIGNTSVETGDGYKWKYMYTIDTADAIRFATPSFVPISPNTSIEQSAVGGTIEVILVDDGGSNYEVFNTGTIQSVVSNTVFRIENTAAVVNNFYTSASVYIETGSGAGSISEITNYVSNTSGKFITTANTLSLATDSQYIISPRVIIEGNGTGAIAYSTVDLNQGVVDRIFVQTIGSNYTFANVQIVANTIHGSGAAAAAIISPLTGHGSDPANELGANKIAITVNYVESESNTIPSTISFRQAGIVKGIKKVNEDELFDATTFNHTVSFDINYIASVSFSPNEIIQGITSGATAEVINSSLSECKVLMISNTNFTDGEQVFSPTSGIEGSISNVTSRDVNKNTGEVLYYTNFLPLTRQETSSETIKLIITI